MVKRIISEKQAQKLKEKAKFKAKPLDLLNDKDIKDIVIMLAKEHGILKDE